MSMVAKNIKLMLLFLKYNMLSSMAYRFSFLTQLIGMILNNVTFLFMWGIIFRKFEVPGFFNFRDIVLLYSISTTSFGLSYLLFGNLSNIAQIVIDGDLDSYLLQPQDVLINLLCSRSILSAWGDIVYGVLLFFCTVNIKSFLVFLFGTFCSMLVFSSIIIIVNAIVFYANYSEDLSNLVSNLIQNLNVYPESIYNPFTKLITRTILPAAFISHIPVRILQDFSFKWAGILLAVSLAWFVGAYLFFHKGLKRYESGNCITNKI